VATPIASKYPSLLAAIDSDLGAAWAEIMEKKKAMGELKTQIAAGGGKAELKTVQGETLTATEKNGGIALTDTKGNTAMVTIADVMQSNGVIHVVDKVLMP